MKSADKPAFELVMTRMIDATIRLMRLGGLSVATGENAGGRNRVPQSP